MSDANLILGPNAIFKKTAQTVIHYDENLHQLCENLIRLLYDEGAVGVAAPMMSILERVIAYDLQDKGIRKPTIMINPKIIDKSMEQQKFEEASICFPGISAEITRSRFITVEYYDQKGEQHQMKAEGYLATVIQHEIDYLDGILFLDYLSPLKRKMLLKKYQKTMG